MRAVTANAEHADVAPWYAAEAALTKAYCDVMAGAAVADGTAAALADQLERKWGTSSPFARRGRAQAQVIDTAKSR